MHNKLTKSYARILNLTILKKEEIPITKQKLIFAKNKQ